MVKDGRMVDISWTVKDGRTVEDDGMPSRMTIDGRRWSGGRRW
jgi:hypothetical protein